jgi:hypothetical protein
MTPRPGPTITFLNVDPASPDVFRRAVVTGPALVDPHTGVEWLPVICPDRSRNLVSEALVVDRADPGAQPARTAHASKSLDIVRGAVEKAICRLAQLPGPPLTGWDQVRFVLSEFLTAVSPIRRTVRALRKAEPSGGLAVVVHCLVAAAWHLDAGDVEATRTTIVAGAVAMDHYLKSRD